MIALVSSQPHRDHCRFSDHRDCAVEGNKFYPGNRAGINARRNEYENQGQTWYVTVAASRFSEKDGPN